jgi:hypothetical protein
MVGLSVPSAGQSPEDKVNDAVGRRVGRRSPETVLWRIQYA